jgi:hypothetical protein
MAGPPWRDCRLPSACACLRASGVLHLLWILALQFSSLFLMFAVCVQTALLKQGYPGHKDVAAFLSGTAFVRFRVSQASAPSSVRPLAPCPVHRALLDQPIVNFLLVFSPLQRRMRCSRALILSSVRSSRRRPSSERWAIVRPSALSCLCRLVPCAACRLAVTVAELSVLPCAQLRHQGDKRRAHFAGAGSRADLWRLVCCFFTGHFVTFSIRACGIEVCGPLAACAFRSCCLLASSRGATRNIVNSRSIYSSSSLTGAGAEGRVARHV